MQKVLLVEDDRTLGPLILNFLKDHHFETAWSEDGDQGWRDYLSLKPDAVILDLMLPGKDGLTLCREIGQHGDAGILILTAKGGETDRILGLELGADDYLSKPFSLREMLARLKAILRRKAKWDSAALQCFHFGDFRLDTERRILTKNNEAIDLTRSEFDLLMLLVERRGRVVSRNDMLEYIRGGETEALQRAVDSHVSNLRRKIEPDPKSSRFIKTIWGIGYRFERP